VKVLVHADPDGTQFYGLWWVDPDSGLIRSLYLNEQSPQAARGKVLVYQKDNPEVPWSEYFDRLVERPDYFESWHVYDSAGLTPRQMLTSLKPATPPLS
jgi:hypothetical protein